MNFPKKIENEDFELYVQEWLLGGCRLTGYAPDPIVHLGGWVNCPSQVSIEDLVTLLEVTVYDPDAGKGCHYVRYGEDEPWRLPITSGGRLR